MKKIINKITVLGKSFYGLVIYFAIAYIFSFLFKNYAHENMFNYNVILITEDIVLLLLLIIVFRKRLKKDFIDFDKNYNKYLSLGFKAWLIGIVVMIVSNNIIYHFITNSIASNQAANLTIINKLPLYSTITMILTGPFIEEIVFRLSFKNTLKSKKLYYVLSVLIFTSLHVLNGINSPLELLYFIPYGALAISFSYMLDKTDNIYTGAIIHTLHNAITIVLVTITGIL